MLEEKIVLKSIEVIPGAGVNVAWNELILKEGYVVASNIVRRAFGINQRSDFLSIFPHAIHYADDAGLTDKKPEGVSSDNA